VGFLSQHYCLPFWLFGSWLLAGWNVFPGSTLKVGRERNNDDVLFLTSKTLEKAARTKKPTNFDFIHGRFGQGDDQTLTRFGGCWLKQVGRNMQGAWCFIAASVVAIILAGSYPLAGNSRKFLEVEYRCFILMVIGGDGGGLSMVQKYGAYRLQSAGFRFCDNGKESMLPFYLLLIAASKIWKSDSERWEVRGER
jgi:hypothetical protein